MTESPFEPPTAPPGTKDQPAATVSTRRVVAATVVGVLVFVVSMAVFWALAIGFTMAWVAALTAALGPEEAVAKPLLVLAPTVVVGFIAHLGAGGVAGWVMARRARPRHLTALAIFLSVVVAVRILVSLAPESDLTQWYEAVPQILGAVAATVVVGRKDLT